MKGPVSAAHPTTITRWHALHFMLHKFIPPCSMQTPLCSVGFSGRKPLSTSTYLVAASSLNEMCWVTHVMSQIPVTYNDCGQIVFLILWTRDLRSISHFFLSFKPTLKSNLLLLRHFQAGTYKRMVNCQRDRFCVCVAIPSSPIPVVHAGKSPAWHTSSVNKAPAVTPVSCCHQNKQATTPVWTHGICGLVPSIDSLIPPSPSHKRLYWQAFLSRAHIQVTLIVKICVLPFGASSVCAGWPSL